MYELLSVHIYILVLFNFANVRERSWMCAYCTDYNRSTLISFYLILILNIMLLNIFTRKKITLLCACFIVVVYRNASGAVEYTRKN